MLLKRIFKFTWGIAVLSLFICNVEAAQLTVEDFDAHKDLRDGMGTWAKKNATISADYSSKEMHGSGGSSLQLKYNVSAEKQEAGFWCALGDKELSGLGEITFWVKGEKGGEVFAVGLKDKAWLEEKLNVNKYLPEGIKTTWEKVTIPLSDFKAISDWYKMDNFSFTFHNKYGQPYGGAVYIDDICFEGERTGVTRPAKIRWEMPPLKSLTDEQFLDLVQKSAAMFFWNEANPENGLIKDICNTTYADGFPMSSIASVGFGLPSLCVAESRGWIPKEKVYERILTTLKFFRDGVENVHGFYYHFLDMQTGDRWGDSELSSIDTALLIAGVVFAGEYFKGTEIEKVAKEIYDRVDWQWMLNGGTAPSMGWKPESGFLSARWGSYTEHLILNILGIGSSTHPMPAESWSSFSRPITTYKNYKYTGPPALFTHQYSHIFVDFRNKEDDFMNYFENSVQATLANRQWAIDNMSSSKTYGPDSWGLTAGDGPDGYKAYGAPYGAVDGTVLPTAAAGSIVFTPELSIRALKYMYTNYNDKIWGKYGFVDSFNWDKDWISSMYIGIDQGPIVLMIENYRTGMVWKYFMRNENIKRALKSCGFRGARKLIDTVDLRGKWYFKTGDDLSWAKKKAVVNDWRLIKVPSVWENEGFGGYDGYAWYQLSFRLPPGKNKKWKGMKIILNIGAIDDDDQTFFNGKLIGHMGQFPPQHETAWDRERNYEIPFELINFTGYNIIAVRVYDAMKDGGIWREPVQIKVVKETESSF